MMARLCLNLLTLCGQSLQCNAKGGISDNSSPQPVGLAARPRSRSRQAESIAPAQASRWDRMPGSVRRMPRIEDRSWMLTDRDAGDVGFSRRIRYL
ncbi:MAG: hypothetical protein ACO3NC_08800 [Pseudohongiellaceae bacterium]